MVEPYGLLLWLECKSGISSNTHVSNAYQHLRSRSSGSLIRFGFLGGEGVDFGSTSASFVQHHFSRHTRPSSQTHKVGLLTLFTRGVRLVSMHFLEELLQSELERMVLGALIEFADEVATGN